MREFIAPGLGPLQLLDCLPNAEPHPAPLHVASFQKGIGAHGSMSRRLLAVLLYEDVGGAVDVEVGGDTLAKYAFANTHESSLLPLR